MSLNSRCTQCSRPLEIESASGLCVECLRTANSPGSTSKDQTAVKPAVDPHAATVSAADVSINDATRSHRDPSVAKRTESLPASADSILLPPSPPGYDLIHELGIGGMGAVYLAREIVSERRVAIKFLQRPGHPGAFDRFGVEVKTLGAIEHPNIIRYYASDFLRSTPYFTFEYAAGGCLLKKLESQGPFEPREAARIMVTVARAIHAAHGANIIHRDIKPSNILLSSDGRPKVSDFGLAKRLDQNDDLTTGTGPLGSPPYMAPEQTGRDEGKIDPRTDVYGLGATLYHLVTGRRPFLGTQDELIRQVKSERPLRMRSVRREIPQEIEAITLKCLEKDPARRYQSAEALAVDLDKFLSDDRSIDAPLLTPWRRAGQWVRRRRKGIAVAVAMMLIVVLTPVAYFQIAKPIEPDKELQRALQSGRSYTIVPEQGLPRWHRWAYGATALEQAPAAGKACAFETIQNAMLELCSDPGVDRYSVSGELCLQRVRLANGEFGNPLPTNLAGLYFASATPDGQIQTFLAASYNDYLEHHTRALGITQASTQVLRVCLLPNAPTAVKGPTGGVGPTIRFPPVDGLPGEWRRFRIDVAPEAIRVFWAANPAMTPINNMTLMVELTADRLDKQFQELRKTIDSAHPGLGAQLPHWHPRMPFGIWCRGGSVAVKNVTISPFPPSPM